MRIFRGMIAALALLPENDVRLGLENLKEIANEMQRGEFSKCVLQRDEFSKCVFFNVGEFS